MKGIISLMKLQVLKESFLLPLYSAPLRSHLEHCIQLWGPQVRTWRRLEHLCSGVRLGELGLFSLEEKELWGDPTDPYNA